MYIYIILYICIYIYSKVIFSTALMALGFSALYIPDYYGKRIVVEELDDATINSDMKKV